MSCPSHSPRLHHSNYTWRRLQAMKLLIMQLSTPPITTKTYREYKQNLLCLFGTTRNLIGPVVAI
jgi:hypothetical protein